MIKIIIVKLIKIYQRCMRPILGEVCRYSPSCSTYCINAICEYGVLKGVWRAILRIMRCHPLASGGYDPVVRKDKKGRL
ncbi:MAG: membrane protein insertion efficiency factor YidD [Candidatus Omnitrophica bacterium]|nr:membrane protein insertion efficiency factor YidD [Candidatus Omnitrophota bacterium]